MVDQNCLLLQNFNPIFQNRRYFLSRCMIILTFCIWLTFKFHIKSQLKKIGEILFYLFFIPASHLEKWNKQNWKDNFNNIFLECWWIDVTPKVANRNANVYVAVKWRLSLRKRFVCSSYCPTEYKDVITFQQVFLGSSIKPSVFKFKFLYRIESPLYCHVSSLVYKSEHEIYTGNTKYHMLQNY
jgi:hypothetical protein